MKITVYLKSPENKYLVFHNVVQEELNKIKIALADGNGVLDFHPLNCGSITLSELITLVTFRRMRNENCDCCISC